MNGRKDSSGSEYGPVAGVADPAMNHRIHQKLQNKLHDV